MDDFQKFYLQPTPEQPFQPFLQIGGNTVLQQGNLQSPNFKTGQTGWSISATGAAEFTSLTVSGTSTLGGFTLTATTISASGLVLDSSGQRISLGSGNNIVILDADDATYRLWVGNATAASAPFSVDKTGATVASNITITGGSVGGTTTVGISNVNIAARGWNQNCAFTVASSTQVNWAAGTFRSADGTSYSISSGNTGSMSAKTYIYLDIGVSITAYQITTTQTTAVGSGKVLVAVAQNNTSEATFQVLNDSQRNIDAANVVANSITANELSTSITYAGTIVIDTAGAIRSGQTAYNTGVGWFIGNVSGTAKLSIGDPAGRYLTWDGSVMTINGYQLTTQGNFGGDGSDGALTVSSGTTTIDLGAARYFVKNYSSISITGTGAIQFTNPHTNGTYIVIKSQGACTLTSSATKGIDATLAGAAGGAAKVSVTSVAGDTGSSGQTNLLLTNPGAGASTAPGVGSGGAVGTLRYAAIDARMQKYSAAFIGAGGGSGSIIQIGGAASNTSGVGGTGGASLIIECAGALNFGASFTISCAGAGGGTGVADSNNAVGGGGGGAGGFFLGLYNSLTTNAGTISIAGGVGGNCAPPITTAAGGGGGGSGETAGNAGTLNSSSAKTGGDGAAGKSFGWIKNTDWG
jgi:hypothetical protein